MDSDRYYWQHEDEDDDGIKDCAIVYDREGFGVEPLFADYRGVELARVKYIGSREDSRTRAGEIASLIVSTFKQAERDAETAPDTAEPIYPGDAETARRQQEVAASVAEVAVWGEDKPAPEPTPEEILMDAFQEYLHYYLAHNGYAPVD